MSTAYWIEKTKKMKKSKTESFREKIKEMANRELTLQEILDVLKVLATPQEIRKMEEVIREVEEDCFLEMHPNFKLKITEDVEDVREYVEDDRHPYLCSYLMREDIPGKLGEIIEVDLERYPKESGYLFFLLEKEKVRVVFSLYTGRVFIILSRNDRFRDDRISKFYAILDDGDPLLGLLDDRLFTSREKAVSYLWWSVISRHPFFWQNLQEFRRISEALIQGKHKEVEEIIYKNYSDIAKDIFTNPFLK